MKAGRNTRRRPTIARSPIFLLHVMNGDGTDMHQISFNTNHDFAPSVLEQRPDRVLALGVRATAARSACIAPIPTAPALELYYGANSHATGANIAGTNNNVIQFLNARARADGKLRRHRAAVPGHAARRRHRRRSTPQSFVEIHQPSTPSGAAGHRRRPAPPRWASPPMRTCPRSGGRFASVYPLYDGTNRMLVSWSPCLVLDTTVTPNTTNVCTTVNTTGANVHAGPAAVHARGSMTWTRAP